ncbi:hypothetical protein GCM10025857_26800 [Alicyclobacillus contaminans]|uniref:hypothetical protein n=1 Tax=Alicyclobacillus contaminans TaxID=392016 RepID=UPI00041C6E3E|nr:hypothetical protein [Alicyclobacillus contaminans]GMA51323.1 hypothetical protein GCM10025857_26800 [Alicyclobacillus contaminans]
MLFSLFIALMIGIGSNLDNCGLAIAYGTAGMKISHAVNATINGVGLAAAWIGAMAGAEMSRLITVDAAKWLACLGLSMMGCVILYFKYIHPRLVPSQSGQSVPAMRPPSIRHGLVIGMILSVSNLASGFSGVVANPSAFWFIVASITGMGYFVIWLGNTLAKRWLAALLGEYASLAAGAMLILLAVCQVST